MKKNLIVLGIVSSILFYPVSFAVAKVAFTPVRFEFNLNPGESATDTIKMINTSDQAQKYVVTLMNFRNAENDEQGHPQLYAPGTALDNGRGTAQFISVTRDPITVEARAEAYIPFSVIIPESTSGGSYYGVILVGSIGDEAILGGGEGEIGAEVGIRQQSGPLMLINVRGDQFSEDLDIIEFFRDKSWYSSLPVELFARIQNNGTAYVKPGGVIKIRNMFGRVSKTIQFNEVGGNVLPGSIRKFTEIWRKNEVSEHTPEIIHELRNFGLGFYTAELTFIYEKADGSSVSDLSTQRFLVLPWQLILIVLAVLIFMRFIQKKYNAFVIRSAQHQQGGRR